MYINRITINSIYMYKTELKQTKRQQRQLRAIERPSQKPKAQQNQKPKPKNQNQKTENQIWVRGEIKHRKKASQNLLANIVVAVVVVAAAVVLVVVVAAVAGGFRHFTSNFLFSHGANVENQSLFFIYFFFRFFKRL